MATWQLKTLKEIADWQKSIFKYLKDLTTSYERGKIMIPNIRLRGLIFPLPGSFVLLFLFIFLSNTCAADDTIRTEIHLMTKQADSLSKVRQLDSAFILANLALEKARQQLGESDTLVASALNSLGAIYFYRGDYARCETLWNQALTTREKILSPEHPEIGNSLNNLAVIYLYQAKYAQAERLYRRSLEIREKALGPEHQDVAASLNNLAMLYWKQGKYPEAEPFFRRTLKIWEKTLGPEHPQVALALNNLGSIYFQQGRYVEAERLFNRALAIRENVLGPEHPDVAQSLTNLAILYDHQGEYAEAVVLQKRTLAIWEQTLGPDHPNVALALNNLATLEFNLGRYEEAEPFYKRALNISEKNLGAEHPEVARCLNGLGNLHYIQGEYAKAEPLFERALSIREKILGPEHPDVSICLSNLAKLYGSAGESVKGLANYRRLQEAKQNFIEYTFSYASEDQKMSYIKRYPLIDHSLFSFALMDKSDKSRMAALEMALKSKAVVLDAVSAEKEIAYCSYDERIRNKVEKHAVICGQIAALSLKDISNIETGQYRDSLQTLYDTKSSLEAELSKSCAEFRSELQNRRFKLEDVADAIPNGSILWEFVQYKPYDFERIGSNQGDKPQTQRYLAFTLDHSGEVTVADLGVASEIDSLVDLTRKIIYDTESVIYSIGDDESEKILNVLTSKLYHLIFAPLESSLKAATNVFISLDGQLNLLPFGILPDDDGKYVIEKYNICYLSSGRDLLKFKKKQKYSDWALVMADPDFDLSRAELVKQREKVFNKSEHLAPEYVPSRGISNCLSRNFKYLSYSQDEAEAVALRLRQEARLDVSDYYGSDALEEVLKAMTESPRVLHLSTHGYFCEDRDLAENKILENPLLRSGIALTGANHSIDSSEMEDSNIEDGILTAFEVSGLNLVGTELVTLSACETGVGEVKNSEGVYGLRRAFQHAGARTILMSLWKIPDKETYELMDNFYRLWLDGQSKQEALRQATLRVLDDRRKKHGAAHPYFWGAFILLGDPQ